MVCSAACPKIRSRLQRLDSNKQITTSLLYFQYYYVSFTTSWLKFNIINGFEANKQLISIFYLFHFGDQEQNDLIIAGCELKREKYLNALYEKGEEESEIDWLMWY